MAWNCHAIEQMQLRRQHRVDGVGRPKFDFHTARDLTPSTPLDGVVAQRVPLVSEAPVEAERVRPPPLARRDADVRRVFRSVESEDAVALDALLAFVEA